MDPLLGKTALDVAVDRATDLLRSAKERREEDVARCLGYLDAALAAIEGLEQEYDAILVEAGLVGGDPARITALERRIDTYLKVDRLRPRLHDAIVGLDFYCGEFETAAAKFLQWPWKRSDRARAADEFRTLLSSLRDYLRRLEQEGLDFRGAGTGVGIEALVAVKQALHAPPGLRAATPQDIARRYQATRDKEPMFDYIGRIRLGAETIRKAFA